MNRIIPFLILAITLTAILYAKDANQVQPIDASQRNQITSGGGGAGDVTEAGDNDFTGDNTFAGTSTFSSNTVVTGRLGINTNSWAAGYALVIAPVAGQTSNIVALDVGTSGSGSFYAFDDGGANVSVGLDGASSVRIDANGSGLVDAYIRVGGSIAQRWSASSVTIGPSGTTLTKINSATVTYDAPEIASTDTFATNIALSGATVNCAASIRLPAAPTAGIVYQGFCPSNNFMTLQMLNITASPVNPANQTVGVTVINH